MLPAATAVRVLAPASLALILAIYKYYKSGAKTEVPDHMSLYPPDGGGSNGGAPPHLPDDRAPPDLDPAVVDAILNLVNAHLEANRNFNNPAVPDEILSLTWNFDPADGIVDKVEKLCLEENNKRGEQEPACTNGPSSSSSSETQSPIIVQGGRPDHEPSDLDPATLDQIRRLDPAVLDEMLKLAPLILDQMQNQKAASLPPGECWTYLRTGTCKDRSSCKFKHPPRTKDNQVSKDKEKKKEELAEKPGRTECKSEFRSQGCKNGKAGTSNHSKGQPSVAPVGESLLGVPLQLSEFRSQGCKNGKAGTSNHSKGQPSVAPVGESLLGVPLQPVSKDKPKDKEAEKPGRAESKNDFRSEGHKNAKVRTSNHSRGQPSVPRAEENFLGLPIRPGAKECPYYMRNGACKDELNCKYNHPDPEAAGESDPVSRYGNGGHATFQGASPSTVEPSSARRSLNKTPPYVPPMVIPPSQWRPSQNTELNSYQAPANLPERSMPVRRPYGIDNPVIETTPSQQHPPEKRFLLVCDSFSKTGHFHKSFKCKYQHPPKYQTSVSPSCELSDKGLPLRPGQNICTRYRTYGICNAGSSCKFDHPSSPTFTL